MGKLRHPTRLTLLIVFGAAFGPQCASAQDLPWPLPGTRLRITSLPGPPSGVELSLVRLGFARTSTRDVRRFDDGRVRFSASLVRAGDPFSVVRSSTGNPADFQLAELERVEADGGRVSNWRTGFVVGAVIGAAYGIVLVRAISDDPITSDYFTAPLMFALPFGGLGALIGAVLKTDVWDPVYTQRR